MTVALKIFVEDPYQEFLIAELSDLDFDAFEQGDDYLIAYIPSPRWDNLKREQIERWLAAHDQSTALIESVVQDQNWNKQWEETVAPVAVPPFIVKPTWHDVPREHEDLILLEIDPKMSFGTGYHETTRLLLRMLPEYVHADTHVLDAGTGTGILAVAAAKLGAVHVDAFDIDPWSQRNALENVYLNGVEDAVNIYEGRIESVPVATYDVILANINLNVVAGLMDDFSARLSTGGCLLVSGILLKDRERLLDAAGGKRIDFCAERIEGEWWAGVFGQTIQTP